MIIRNIKDAETIQIKEHQYQGRSYEVKGTRLKWMVHGDLGGPEYRHNYAIRYVTMDPGGIVPLHSHDYEQAAYILEGELIISNEEREWKVGPGDVVYIAPDEAHEFKNASQSRQAVFT